jgi:hypothetical protein
MSDPSTIRRLVRLSDSLRDAVQNPATFRLSPDDVAAMTKVLEKVEALIARSPKM